MIIKFLTILALIVVGAIVIKLIFRLSSTILKVVLHFLTGWIMLSVVNLLPGIYIPINLITLIISGFGGVAGTILLAIFYLLL